MMHGHTNIMLRGTEGTMLGAVIVNTEMPGLQCYGLWSLTPCIW